MTTDNLTISLGLFVGLPTLWKAAHRTFRFAPGRQHNGRQISPAALIFAINAVVLKPDR